MMKQCIICGKEFHVIKVNYKSCSLKCRNESIKKREKNRIWKDPNKIEDIGGFESSVLIKNQHKHSMINIRILS